MKRLVLLVAVVMAAILIWRVGSRLSPDAVGLATGVVFGVLAGLPTAILILASNRNRRGGESSRRQDVDGAYPYGGYPQQPPVIVLAGAPAPQQPDPYAAGTTPNRTVRSLPAPEDEPRRYRMIGESGEVLEDDFV